jgi:ornithine lipid ester-linked acyl 2-hydroxylase
MIKYIIIIILIICFLYYCYQKGKKIDQLFYDPDIYPELNKIHNQYEEIVNEVKNILKDPKNWEKWPEKHLYANNGQWQIFPLYAFDIWVEDNCKKVPVLTNFIRSIPNIKLATLSRLSPGMKLVPHEGWGKHSNYVLRAHYGIIVPENKCYIQVSRNNNIEQQYHENNKWIIFDDSKTHMAENKSNEERIVLIVDLERPSNIKTGTSTVGDTKELMEIINYFKSKNLTRINP